MKYPKEFNLLQSCIEWFDIMNRFQYIDSMLLGFTQYSQSEKIHLNLIFFYSTLLVGQKVSKVFFLFLRASHFYIAFGQFQNTHRHTSYSIEKFFAFYGRNVLQQYIHDLKTMLL